MNAVNLNNSDSMVNNVPVLEQKININIMQFLNNYLVQVAMYFLKDIIPL